MRITKEKFVWFSNQTTRDEQEEAQPEWSGLVLTWGHSLRGYGLHIDEMTFPEMGRKI